MPAHDSGTRMRHVAGQRVVSQQGSDMTRRRTLPCAFVTCYEGSFRASGDSASHRPTLPSGKDLRRPVGEPWTVAVALAHIQYWDGRVAGALEAPLPSGDRWRSSHQRQAGGSHHGGSTTSRGPDADVAGVAWARAARLGQ